MKPHAALILAVHDRRETTLGCLRHLRAQGDLDWAVPVVVDDGSTDGTAAAVAAEFPAALLLHGSGSLWWTGATELGMRHAVAAGAEYIFWLNDDTLPEPGALRLLLEESRAHRAVAGAASFLPGETAPAYSGMRRGFWSLRRIQNPGTATVPCDALHGNVVCLPAAIVPRLGYPDGAGLPHALGDFDYTLRAATAGIPVCVVGQARAVAQPNLSLNYRSWLLSDVPPRTWWRELRRPGSHLHWTAQRRFHSRHFGPRGLAYCCSLVLRLAAVTAVRLVMPLPLLRRIRGHRSPSWRHEQRHRA